MHRIKDILMHHMNLQLIILSKLTHMVNKILKVNIDFTNIDHHDHDKHILHDILTYFKNIGIHLSAFSRYFR